MTEQAAPQSEVVQAPASETPPTAPDEQTSVVAGPADKPDGDMTPATATDPEGH